MMKIVKTWIKLEDKYDGDNGGEMVNMVEKVRWK